MSEKRLKTDSLVLRLEAGEKDWLRKAAEKDGQSELSNWIRTVVRKAAKRLVGSREPFVSQAEKTATPQKKSK